MVDEGGTRETTLRLWEGMHPTMVGWVWLLHLSLTQKLSTAPSFFDRLRGLASAALGQPMMGGCEVYFITVFISI